MKKNNNYISLKDKTFLLWLTIILDLILLVIFVDDTHELGSNDILFIKTIWIIHFFFYRALYLQLDMGFYHVMFMLSLLYGLFVESIQLRFLILGMLTLVQILWITEKKCILEPHKKWGSKQNSILAIGTIFYFCVLSMRCGYEWAKTSF